MPFSKSQFVQEIASQLPSEVVAHEGFKRGSGAGKKGGWAPLAHQGVGMVRESQRRSLPWWWAGNFMPGIGGRGEVHKKTFHPPV